MAIAQKEMADALGVSQALVSDYVKRGMPLDSVDAAREWRTANVRVRAGSGASASRLAEPVAALRGGGAADLTPDYYESRALREAEEARLSQLKRMELEGSLIRLEAVRSVAANTLAATREALLQLPARLSTVLAAEGSPARVHDLLQQEIHQALAQLATLPERVGAEAKQEAAT